MRECVLIIKFLVELHEYLFSVQIQDIDVYTRGDVHGFARFVKSVRFTRHERESIIRSRKGAASTDSSPEYNF